jgi:glucosamine 6-phosphate synthetase-like amidotransferase/phosphosugar isomerase protein
MCGIAGYSLSPDSRVDRTLAAQALLAGIAERGADAVGYGWRAENGAVEVRKRRSGASALLDEVAVPAHASQVLVHVRDYTKGHPRIEANNHPVRHGAVVGIHNGIIVNDEELFADYGFARQEPEMTVDSEVIFAIAERTDADPRALEELCGSMATAWLDERRPETVFLARSVGRPLWVGHTRREVFFASTRHALEIVEATLRMTLTKREVGEGSLLALEHGRVVRTERFTPDRSHVERPLPAVRAPQEGESCLRRLAAIVATL